ncbi:MAG: DUF2867 domain-containing protein [bacterium]
MKPPSINPEIDAHIALADHVDVHSGMTSKSLRDALYEMIRWQPLWLKSLYAIRTFLAPFFGYRIVGIPSTRVGKSSEIPFRPGDRVFIGCVWRAEENRYWSVSADDRHLSAILLVLREPGRSETARLLVITAVNFKTWRGRLYHRLVLLFHHGIVRSMIDAAK